MKPRQIARLRRSLMLAAVLLPVQAHCEDPPATEQSATSSLEEAFRNPPASARPRVWWHWMNGNITKEGIAKDLAWMKRIGIGGVQNFDANLQTPQVVETRLAYMTPQWQEAFRFAALESDRLGLELAIASSPGWSETGGPWVEPRDGLKKLVWSETELSGGKPFSGRLPAPPAVTGPFQSLAMEQGVEAVVSEQKAKLSPRYYADVAVLAFPAPPASLLVPVVVRDRDGATYAPTSLMDADLTTGINLPAASDGEPQILEYDYAAPVTARSASLRLAQGMFANAVETTLEASQDGLKWERVSVIPNGAVPTTVSFAPVSAKHFRIVINSKAPDMSGFGETAPGMEFGTEMFAGMVGTGDGKGTLVADLRLSGDARVDRFETKAGFAISPDYYALASAHGNAQGIAPSRVIDLTNHLGADGALAWTPPPGHWRVLRLGYSLIGTTNHPATPEATGLEVDKFDGSAVERYLEHYLGMYRQAVGADLLGNRGVRALLTDSIEVGPANWTPRMIERFKQLRGYDPTPWLPALTSTIIASARETDAFLYDFRRTLADLMASEHYGTIARVAHSAGLKVYGEALEDHRPTLGDDMAMRRYTDVPMAAMWTFGRQQGPRATYLADTKGASSVAHVYGQNLVAAESMTSTMNPWNFTPRDLRRAIDLEFVNGVNLPVIHTSVHVPVEDKKPGLSLFIFGQYFNRNETWAEMAKPWIDYIARNSLLLQAGRNVADIAYFYGEEAPLTSLYGDNPISGMPIGFGYDFIGFDALVSQLSTEGNDIVSRGGARYRVIYLGGSSANMTLPALRKLSSLVANGATVIGNRPSGSPSLADWKPGPAREWNDLAARLWPGGRQARIGLGRVFATDDCASALREIGIAPDLAITGTKHPADIPFVHRRDGQNEIYFLLNRLNTPQTVEARFRVSDMLPELWHADSGNREPVSYRIVDGETIVPLTLLPEESVFVIFSKRANQKAVILPTNVPTPVGSLDGPWQIAFQSERGAPATITLPKLAPLNESSEMGVKYFSGIARYSSDFQAPAGWTPGTRLWLDLGEVDDLAEVIVNGKEAGTAWHAPYRIEITDQAVSGRNRIEVRVANKWVNRLIGDAQTGARKITWTALPTYKADAPLERSGLIGPVTLMTTRSNASTR